MKELIEGLNIPKQVIDKTEAFMKALFGSSVDEIGYLLADKIRFRRLKNQIKIFSKTADLVEKNDLSINELNLKTLVPLIEKSSLEEEESLQEKWAILLANIASSPESGLEPKLVSTLSALSSIEVSILDFFYTEAIKLRKERFNTIKEKKWNTTYKKIEDIKLENMVILVSKIEQHFDIEEPYTSIYLDNLESLAVLKYDDPEIEIDQGYPEAEGKIEYDNDNKQYVSIELDLDITSNYWSSNNPKLTSFGIYFIRKCKAILVNN